MEFADLLDLLQTNLGEVVKQIAAQEHALYEAEKEYACIPPLSPHHLEHTHLILTLILVEKATAIISGILALGFLIGAGVALCMGAVPVALELGAHAGVALYECIVMAIKASNISE